MSDHEKCHVEPIEKPLDKHALKLASAALMRIEGMGCPRCATRVQNSLLGQVGVLFVDVQLENGLAAVAYDTDSITTAALETAVQAAGNDGRHSYAGMVIEVKPASEVFAIDGA